MSKNMSQKSKQISVWTMIARILPQVVSVSPWLFILNSIVFIFNGSFFAVSIWCMQILFDRVANLAFNKSSLKATVLALLVLFAVKVLEQIASGVANFIGETYDMKTTGKLSHIINLKMARLAPICFENTEILDDINKSYLGVKFAKNFINTITDVMTLYVPYFLFMGVYLFTLKPILAISLLLVFFPVLFTQLLRVKIFAELEDDSAPLRRKGQYYENCLADREYLKETRILGACPYFIKLLKETLVHMNRLKWKAEVKTNLIELGMKMISLAGYLGILWMLFDALMNEQITVGAFAAVFASVGSMFNMMEEVICERLGYYAQNFSKIQNYLRFLDLPERELDKKVREKTVHGDIILEDVSFSYPLSDKNAVENVNLTIKSGETIAVVGESGYDTMLSREFDGVDLSGGEWQKVAIARGFYREHELIILDEPTAAIDPVEETKIYERFAKIAKDKTAVIVTHRLGSVKFADRIVVMKDGKIVGIGTHDKLLSSCALYADMWKSQAQHYISSNILL